MRENRQFGSPVIVPMSSETGEVTRLERIPYDHREADGTDHDEEWLSETIYQYPEVLPVGELDRDYQPIVSVCRELPTLKGYIDNFYVTPRGNLIFAECKLWRNSEARRKVVAQVLDYIEGISQWNCDDLEHAVMEANRSEAEGKPSRLYNLIKQKTDLDEPSFNDAVSQNLRLGRGLFLIVGDGIREEAETLVNHVGGNPGLQFGLALVEVARYRLPDDGRLLLLPRTIVRTVNVERAVVRIEEGQVSVSEPVAASTSSAGSEDEFFRALAANCNEELVSQLQAFLLKSQEVVYRISNKGSLTLRCRVTKNSEVSLGYIEKNGKFKTDSVFDTKEPWQEVARQYLENVAEIIGGSVQDSENGWPSVKIRDDEIPEITDLLNHEDEWLICIGKFMKSVREIGVADS